MPSTVFEIWHAPLHFEKYQQSYSPSAFKELGQSRIFIVHLKSLQFLKRVVLKS